ncbi:hypothetical protein FQN54_000902 [Arachnomyces sp. PD_36]|nr:hypothetical protein FQN54_000902 [Arachnomyces sp. PD_36]
MTETRPSFSTPPIERLPQEIFSNILKRVRNRTTPSSFLSCILCSKRWRNVALQVLYQDVVLRNSNLGLFLQHLPESCYPFVRSLTVRITPENAQDPIHLEIAEYREEVERLKKNLSPGSKTICRNLANLAEKVNRMDHLSTFSLVLESEGAAGMGFWIPRPTIAHIIDNLPAPCVNLEVDTKGIDHCEPGNAHLCDSLQVILPRLQHFRLRLRLLCPAIFGEGFTTDGTVENESNFKPISAPHLKTLMINCVSKNSKVCGTLQYPETPDFIHRSSPPARLCLASCLRLLVERSSSFPAAERLWLLDSQHPSDQNGMNFASYNRRDVISNKTYAIPYRRIWPSDRNSVLTRTPEGIQGLSASWVIEIFAEDEIWKETTNGSRIPAGLLSAEDWETQGYLKMELPLESESAWREGSGKRTCALWVNEKKAGVPLLDTVEREGLTDTSPVVELTPPGWTRSDSPSQMLLTNNGG